MSGTMKAPLNSKLPAYGLLSILCQGTLTRFRSDEGLTLETSAF